jgi:hypothetical protein
MIASISDKAHHLGLFDDSNARQVVVGTCPFNDDSFVDIRWDRNKYKFISFL